MKKMKIALVGNTNVGKTTLLNTICRLNKETSNYPGTTVEVCKSDIVYEGSKFEFIDLPGIYSLTSFSEEEKVSTDILLNEKFDLIVQVMEATCKRRSLAFTLELMELNIPLIICINDKKGESKDSQDFLDDILVKLNIPGVIIQAQNHKLCNRLLSLIQENKMDNSGYEKILLDVYSDYKETINSIRETYGLTNIWLALKIMENDTSIISKYIDEQKRIEAEKYFIKNLKLTIRQLRFKYLDREIKIISCSNTVGEGSNGSIKCVLNNSDKIDSFLLNKFIGLPIFFLIMWGVFEATFKLSSYPMGLLDSFFSWMQLLIGNILGENLVSSLLIDGIIGGLGATFIFIPQIIILFFFISLMKQSGYLARTAYILDNTMKKIGLSGKSFVPLLMGFGCNVPAIMATRTLPTFKERLITAMMIPFMSCSARLPVYTLFISAFVAVNYRGTVMFSLYMFGILFGIVTAIIMKRVIQLKPKSLIIELPCYSIPSIKTVWDSTWSPTKSFMKKAILVILPFTILVWGLFSFPTLNGVVNMENTYASKIGKSIEFVFKPIGFDWRISTAVLSGFAAKEIFVSTFGTLYSLEEGDEDGLVYAIQNDPIFTPPTVASLLVFMLLYSPCIAVFSVIKQEFGGKWALISLLYPTILAWVISFFVYRIFLIIF